MKFRSVLGESPSVSFREALFRGLAPDGSLYIPEHIPQLPLPSEHGGAVQRLPVVASEVLGAFIDDIPMEEIRAMAERAFNFPIPLVRLEQNLFLLELFHGPTLAFKDVGARFMARALSYFLERERQDLTIVVATSGDTGSAVAHGFFNVPNISVFVFYPSGKISRLQEQQMTTLGGNIHAVEVEGTFDDCQRLVKSALADRDLVRALNLTTANSINLGRLIPQIMYYAWAAILYGQMPGEAGRRDRGPVFAVPSGNFGNLTAATYSKHMGVPIVGLISASNSNDVVPEYFKTGLFTPRRSQQTFSNAMDVGNPSNFDRLRALYGNDLQRIRNEITALSVGDDETLTEMRRTYDRCGYVLDPHTAVGVVAARGKSPSGSPIEPTIVAATAHPAKFPEVVTKALGITIPLPPQLEEAMNRPKQSVRIHAEYEQARELLRS
ncbi:MAG: threonine synthase [Ignavibacteriales bacterium]|nr:threonine synthase [Ignavibacteriales bacterium]